jgi:hypothetical protein
VDGTSSESCLTVGFSISGGEYPDSAAGDLVTIPFINVKVVMRENISCFHPSN